MDELVDLDMDCNGCGRDCNKPQNVAEEGRIFRDYFTLTRSEGNYFITHTPQKKKKIDFGTLKMTIE